MQASPCRQCAMAVICCVVRSRYPTRRCAIMLAAGLRSGGAALSAGTTARRRAVLSARADRPCLAVRRVGHGDPDSGQLVPEPVGGREIPGLPCGLPGPQLFRRAGRQRPGRPAGRCPWPGPGPSSWSTYAKVSNFDPGGISASFSRPRSARRAAGVSRSSSNAPVMSPVYCAHIGLLGDRAQSATRSRHRRSGPVRGLPACPRSGSAAAGSGARAGPAGARADRARGRRCR